MRRLNLAAFLGSMVIGVFAVGCGGGNASEAETPVETAAPTVQIRSLLASSNDSRLVATIRGPGQIGYLAPETTREGNEIVTVFRIQNISDGALAGLSAHKSLVFGHS